MHVTNCELQNKTNNKDKKKIFFLKELRILEITKKRKHENHEPPRLTKKGLRVMTSQTLLFFFPFSWQ